VKRNKTEQKRRYCAAAQINAKNVWLRQTTLPDLTWLSEKNYVPTSSARSCGIKQILTTIKTELIRNNDETEGKGKKTQLSTKGTNRRKTDTKPL